MTTLEERRHQADMLHMYKLCSRKLGQDRADWFRPPTEAAARTQHYADPLNMRPNHGRLEIRCNFFTVRAGEPWNMVPGSIKRAGTAAGFKKAYAKFRDKMINNSD
jgi:hypothetical protein